MYGPAHKIIVLHLAPEFLLAGTSIIFYFSRYFVEDYSFLLSLLTHIDSSAVANWNIGGAMFLEFIDLVENVPTFLEKLVNTPMSSDLGVWVEKIKLMLKKLSQVKPGDWKLFRRADQPLGKDDEKSLCMTYGVLLAEMTRKVLNLLNDCESVSGSKVKCLLFCISANFLSIECI